MVTPPDEWEQGHSTAALQLELLWNETRALVPPFALLWAYPTHALIGEPGGPNEVLLLIEQSEEGNTPPFSLFFCSSSQAEVSPFPCSRTFS